jgi:hypothetical protein
MIPKSKKVAIVVHDIEIAIRIKAKKAESGYAPPVLWKSVQLCASWVCKTWIDPGCRECDSPGKSRRHAESFATSAERLAGRSKTIAIQADK